jgi:predicted metal-dependent hydrolase
MDLHVRPGTSAEQRERVLHVWYRQQLNELIPRLVENWQSALGVEVADWGIRKVSSRMTSSLDIHGLEISLY